MGRLFIVIALVAGVFFPNSALLSAEEPARLRVGVFDKPPFAMKDESGQWIGLAVFLWEKIAKDQNLEFAYVEAPLDDLQERLSAGELDLVVGELAVSAERERRFDFTQPFVISPAAVALSQQIRAPHFWDLLEEMHRHGVFWVICAMIATLIFFAAILWVVERKRDVSHFGGKPLHGLGSALWFGAVTMTTVGYGDKTPQTPTGRLIAFLWMFLGIILVGAFTGALASSFTLAHIRGTIDHPRDLVRYKNGVMEGSLAQMNTRMLGIQAKSFETTEEGLQALKDGKISAFIGDEITLHYLVQKLHPDTLEVCSLSSSRLMFAIAARPHFPLLETINVAVIEAINSPEWPTALQRWVGPEASGY